MENNNLKGVYTAIITPLKKDVVDSFGVDDIDWIKWNLLIEEIISSGVSGIVLCGTTGQGPLFDWNAQLEISKRVTEIVNGRVKIIYGASSNVTHEVVSYCKRLIGTFGSDVTVLSSSGYYNKPQKTGLYNHYKTISETGCKVILYHVPSRGSDIPLDVVKKLSNLDNIIAVKDAVETTERLKEIKQHNSDFIYLSGEDNVFNDMLKDGGDGIISASANIIPKLFVDMYKETDQNKRDEIQKHANEFVNYVFSCTNPIPLAYMFKTNLGSPLSTDDMDDTNKKEIDNLISKNQNSLGIDYNKVVK